MNQQLDRPIAYTIEPHPFFMGDLEFGEPLAIKHSANAWWMDRVKVYALLIAFRYGANIKTACVFAGISIEQWKYFNETHPDFFHIKARISAIMEIKAGFAINKAIESKHFPTIRWWLTRQTPARWGSAKERVFWAKLAAQQMDKESAEYLRDVSNFDHNVAVAREEVEEGSSEITPVDNQGYPLVWKSAGYWMRKPGAKAIPRKDGALVPTTPA